MAICNRKAYHLLKEKGHSVIVLCARCGKRFWTHQGKYISETNEWFCSECSVIK